MSEAQLQTQLAEYIRFRYPGVMFHSDFGSGVKLTPGQAIKQKRQNGGRRAWPDMFIAEPTQVITNEYPCKGVMLGKASNGFYCAQFAGLFLELKRKGTRLKKKNGEWATPHIAEQADVLDALAFRGYKAVFAIGFDEAKAIIDDYLKNMANSVMLGQEE